MKIYNTLTRRQEEFEAIKAPKVLFYQCGPTVYWTQHIGNLRAATLADLIHRSLKYLGYKVKFAKNYTDVGHLTSDEDTGEDKMEKGVKREGLTPKQIADKYIKIYEQDAKDLNIIDPDYKPRATKYIKPMQEMVQVLLDKGYAYATDLAIYFDVGKVKDYTALSGQDLDKNIADAGKGEASDKNKKNPHDFAVWFFAAGVHAKALQTWPSKFRLTNGQTIKKNGFPGWHLECSAMIKKLFGNTIDIHMGGIEHIPVHHTNEIAQSEAANGKKFVNYWLHNEHLTVNGEKMSKSTGTGYSLAEIKEKSFDPLVLRYFFLQANYRSKQNFTWEAMTAAATAYNNLREKIRELSGRGKILDKYNQQFKAAIGNDFNLPQALAIVWEILKDSSTKDADKKATILAFDKVFGLGLDKKVLVTKIPAVVKELAAQRLAARQNKNWLESDRLRDEIKKLGYIMEDEKDGYKLRKV